MPWSGLWLDHRYRLVWRLPFWIEIVAAIFTLLGIVIALRYCWMCAFDSFGKSSSTEALSVEIRWRNATLLGVWLCGIGLACLLRSISTLGLFGMVLVAGVFILQYSERRTTMPHTTKYFLPHINWIPRWSVLLLAVAATAPGVLEASVDQQSPPVATEPAIVVQIHCKPGAASLWEALFNEHVRPAIEETIANGNTFTGFQFLQSTLPFQSFDFMLIYTGKSFAGFDKPGPFPHYITLFRREGSLRALSTLKDMSAYEDQVSVTLVYLKKVR